jgi:hypothetical protein
VAPLPPVDVAKTEPVAKLTMDEFLPAARQNPVETNAKYLGKVIQLKGNVSFTYRRITKGVVVGTMFQLAKTSGDSIACETSDPEAWKNIGTGTEVTLKGKLAAHVLRPREVSNPASQIGNLVECVILEAGPGTRVVMTPDQFVEEYNTIGEDKFFKKHYNKELLIEGEVIGHDQATMGDYYAVLKTSTKTKVGLAVGPKKESLANYPVGQKASAIGFFNSAIRARNLDTLMIQSNDIVTD